MGTRAKKSTPSDPLSESIAKVLSDRVIRGVYAPNERLVEAELSKEFGVSHGPIRDALRWLQRVGLATIHPYRGAQITDFSIREVYDLYQVRASLVSLRARWIAEDDDREVVLSRIADHVEMLQRLADDDPEAFVTESFVVNNMLTESLTNRWLRGTIEAITLQTSRYSRVALLASQARRRESAFLWQMLFDAIRSGDGDLAANVSATLSITARDAAVKYLEDRSDT